MNGLDATRRIKDVLPHVQVIIITVHENPEYKIDAAAAGVSAYVIKRNITKELRNVMKSMLSHPEERN
jgi:DNA-binding NarL/FixJ family response regulator